MPQFSSPGMNVPPDVRRRFTRRITRDGLRIRVTLSEGLWIKAPFYAIEVSTPTLGDRTSYSINRPYARCGVKEFEALIAKIHTAGCAIEGCGRRFLADNPGNPEGLCPPHLLEKIKADAAREMKEQNDQARRENATAKKRGLRWRAEIWIHRDGDDCYILRFFKRKPSPEALRKIARVKRSKLWDDYRLVRI